MSTSIPSNVLVIGCVMNDQYSPVHIITKSPEPGADFQIDNQHARFKLGGAANVAGQLSQIGLNTALVGLVGETEGAVDDAGRKIKRMLADHNIGDYLIASKYPTIVKQRFDYSSDLQQTSYARRIIDALNDNSEPGKGDPSGRLFRISHQSADMAIDEHTIAKVYAQIDAAYEAHQPKVVAYSGYAKHIDQIPDLFQYLVTKGVPIIADIKPNNIAQYKGAHIITPNAKEAYEMTGLNNPIDAGRKLRDDLETSVVVTLSEKGIAYFGKDGTDISFPAAIHSDEFKDPTGAGDVVVGYLVEGTLNKRTPEQMLQIANEAGGISVKHSGCYHTRPSELEHYTTPK